MKLTFELDESDVQRLRGAYELHRDDKDVRERERTNLSTSDGPADRDLVWNQMALALTTSQQRSGPGTRVFDLYRKDPCPLRLEAVRLWQPTISDGAASFLKDWGGIRCYNNIGKHLQHNYNVLFEGGKDRELNRLVDELAALKTATAWDEKARLAERRICSAILSLGLMGIADKQCRNWLINAGLLRYEVPLDSRVVKFLKPMMPGFPLEPKLLGCPSFYMFIEDILQELCKRADLFPCVADEVMFLSKEGRRDAVPVAPLRF